MTILNTVRAFIDSSAMHLRPVGEFGVSHLTPQGDIHDHLRLDLWSPSGLPFDSHWQAHCTHVRH